MAAETTAVEPQAAAGPAGSERGRLTRYTLVAVLVRLADEGARVALSFLALSRHTGTAYAGLLVAALMVPHVLAAPFVGALAGILAGVFNPAMAVYALAGAVVAGTAVLCTLPIRSRRTGDDGEGRTGGAPRAGVLAAVPVMWRSRSLGAVTVASGVAQIGAGGLPLIAALMASDYGGTAWAGGFLSTFAVGSLIGSILYARFPITAWRPERLVLAGLLISAVPFALVPLMPSPWLCLPWLALAGVINGPLFASLFVVRDREAPAHVHTQIFTLGAGLKGTAAAGGAALTGLCAGLGTGPLLLGVAGSYALASAIGALILRGSPRSATAATR
jgi:hypothetical protein